ncbi:MAG: hypothetical protein RIQ56_658 [Candidatus Parcubacteria bacterium]
MGSFFKTPAGFIWLFQALGTVAVVLGLLGAPVFGYQKDIVLFFFAGLGVICASIMCAAIPRQGTAQFVFFILTFGLLCALWLLIFSVETIRFAIVVMCLGTSISVFICGLCLGNFTREAFAKALILTPVPVLIAATDPHWSSILGIMGVVSLLLIQGISAFIFGTLQQRADERHIRVRTKFRTSRV